jgi:hypothetical protein
MPGLGQLSFDRRGPASKRLVDVQDRGHAHKLGEIKIKSSITHPPRKKPFAKDLPGAFRTFDIKKPSPKNLHATNQSDILSPMQNQDRP